MIKHIGPHYQTQHLLQNVPDRMLEMTQYATSALMTIIPLMTADGREEQYRILYHLPKRGALDKQLWNWW